MHNAFKYCPRADTETQHPYYSHIWGQDAMRNKHGIERRGLGLVKRKWLSNCYWLEPVESNPDLLQDESNFQFPQLSCHPVALLQDNFRPLGLFPVVMNIRSSSWQNHIRDKFVTVGSWLSIGGDVTPALSRLHKPFIGQLSDAVNPASRLL